jgi:hypothetical protein
LDCTDFDVHAAILNAGAQMSKLSRQLGDYGSKAPESSQPGSGLAEGCDKVGASSSAM